MEERARYVACIPYVDAYLLVGIGMCRVLVPLYLRCQGLVSLMFSMRRRGEETWPAFDLDTRGLLVTGEYSLTTDDCTVAVE